MTSLPLLALLCASVLLQSCSVMAQNTNTVIKSSSSTTSSAPGPTIIIAPSQRTLITGVLETRDQGATVWICTALDSVKPWGAYADIRSYLEGGNNKKTDYTKMILFPVMELTHTSSSKLCVYLPSDDHCFPPVPKSETIVIVKQFMKRTYYDIRFWGQASDARVAYYKEKLDSAIKTNKLNADLTLFYLSYFPDHAREVRYDKKG